jgi:DNA-binding NtrC family response regulator
MKKELLYVDDASLQRDLFCIFYKKYYNITMASSPEEAFAIIQTKPFDIVVTDLHFNGISTTGEDFIRMCMERGIMAKYYILTADHYYENGKITTIYKPFEPKSAIFA